MDLRKLFTCVCIFYLLRNHQYIIIRKKIINQNIKLLLVFIFTTFSSSNSELHLFRHQQLSIGVHLLNLLAIPAIVFVIYFKKYQGDKVNIGSFLLAGIISLATLVFIQNIVIPKTVSVAEWIERLFTNTGLPFNSGAFFFVALLIGLITVGLMISSKAKFQLLNTAILAFALLMIGYSSFVMIIFS